MPSVIAELLPDRQAALVQVAGLVVAALLAGDRAEPLKRGRGGALVAELADQLQGGA